MSRCIIIANGNINDYSYYKQRVDTSDYIICADGAIRHCINIGITPDLWIGDFDSCNYKKYIDEYDELKNVQRCILNTRKDETDTHAACMLAVNKGFKKIVLWGSTGSRLDHSLSNIHIMESMLDYDVICEIENERNIINVFRKSIEINKVHKYLSLIPLDKNIKVLKTEGLEYPLENEFLPRCISRGVSNEFLGDYAKIHIEDGAMLVIQSDD